MSLEKSAPGHKRRRRAGSTAAVEARSKAQHIAFAPVIFYATVVLRDTGLLALLARASQKGLTPDELSQASELSSYAVSVLTELAVDAGIMRRDGSRLVLEDVGYFLMVRSEGYTSELQPR